MNRRHVLFLALLIVCTRLQAQTITVSSPVRFDTVLVNTTDSLSFWIRNAGASPFAVTDINTTRPEFRVKDTSFTVPANDSIRVYVYFITNQNVTWNDVVLVTGVGLQGALPLQWKGTGRYSDVLYNSTQGLWENALKTVLTNLVTNHTVLGYNIARDRMFETIDDYNLTDTVECVYIGRRIRATTRTEAQNQNFNTEHTWPQSFFSSNDPMVSDLNHLFPTDAAPNSARANFPFGPVVSNVTYNVGGSKLGNRADGASAFEPWDIHKGDVARALFYFAIRYGNLGNYMDATQENDLRAWYKSDPVSAKEIQRNNRVATYQGKRNPLIDHPEFVDRISYFRTSTSPTLFPDIAPSTTAINFGAVASGDSVEWKLIIIDNGRVSLNVASLALQSSSPTFRIIDTPTSVPVDSFAQVRVRFVPTQANQAYANTLIIHSNDPDEGTVNIALAGSSTSASLTTTLTTPVQSATGVPIPVVFTWFRTQGADRFHLQVSTTNTFSSFVADDSSLVDSSSSVTGLGLNTTYYWRVRSHTGTGWGSYSAVRSFATWTTPPQVVAVTPVNAATGVSIPSLCVWQSSPTATNYQFDLSTSPSFVPTITFDSTLTGTSQSIPGLDQNATYYWRVRAKNGAGWGSYSVTRSFTTWTTPAQVQAIIPGNGATGTPVPLLFTWQSTSTATRYQFDLDTSGSFGSPYVTDSLLTDTVRSVPGLSLGTTYFWRVRAGNGAGWGIHSTTRNFTTWSAPGQAQAVSPDDGALGISISALFLWQTTATATRYRFDLSTSNTFGSFLVADSSLTDTLRSVQGLASNTTYYWRVRAGNGAGWGTHSNTRSFTTLNTPAQVQLQSPPDHVRGIPPPVQFAWQMLPGATAYHIEISASESFGTVIASDSTLTDTTHGVSGLDSLATYYWRVRARNNAGWGQFSLTWQFRVAARLTVTTQMNSGWNIVSVPVLPVDPSATALFPAAVSAAYAYSNGYVQRDTLHPGLGYWLKLGPSPSVSISGEPIFSDTIEVNAGWNFVGSISYPVPADSIASSPQGIVLSSFYEFNSGYVSSATLLPLRGYWVHCSQQGRIFLQNRGANRY